MQNIDPVYFLQPLAVLAIAAGLVAYYWKKKHTMNPWVLAYSLGAYAIAIGIKYVFQSLTIQYVNATSNLYILGLYYGLQTAILEVGLAYLFARYAVRRRKMGLRNAGAYGIGLAFWENGVLLGASGLLSLVAIYLALASSSPSAASIYSALYSSSPALFASPGAAVLPIALSIAERISSMLLHYSWGLLALVAAATGKKKYLALALPMGLVDFFVPFASTMPLYAVEAIILAIALVSFAVASIATSTQTRMRR